MNDIIERIKAVHYIRKNPLNLSHYKLNRDFCIQDIENGSEFHWCKECGALEYNHYSTYDNLKEQEYCFTCDFWLSRKDNPKNIIMGNFLYRDCGYSYSEDTKWNGHSGRKFHILKRGYGEIITNNLWSSGIIPERLRKHFPTNAVFSQLSNCYRPSTFSYNERC